MVTLQLLAYPPFTGEFMKKFFLLLASVLIFTACEITFVPPDTIPGNQFRTFWAQDGRIGIPDNSLFYTLNAQKLAEGNYCTVWGEIGNSRATVAIAQTIARAYDTDIYPKMKAVFSVDDLEYEGNSFDDTMKFADFYGDQDGKFCILLLDIRDDYDPRTYPVYTGGYFFSGDFYENASLPSYMKSNECDIIYMDTYPSTPGSPDSIKTLAHEMQHLMNFVHDVAIRDALSDTWLNEGLSSAAEWVYTGIPDTERLAWYNTQSTTISNGNNFFVWDPRGDLDDYATVNLFFQWLRLQSGGGTEIYRAISRSRYPDFNAVVSSMLDYDDWKTLLKTWLAANYINAPTGPYGYMNDRTLSSVRARTVRSGTRSVNLYPGEGVYSVTAGSGNTPNAGSNTNIRYAGLSRGSGDVSDTAVFASGALLTYNINTNRGGRPEAGTTTGVAASVAAVPEGLSARAALSVPFKISAGEMLRRNGHGEFIPPFLSSVPRTQDTGDEGN